MLLSLVIICAGETSTSEDKSVSSVSASMLLTIGLINTGLSAFTALGSRGLNSTRKPLFQPNVANAVAQMSLSLVHTIPTAQRPRLLTCVCVCVLRSVWFFVTPWTITHQPPLSIEFSARIIEWVAISSSREFSQPKDRTHVSRLSYIDRQILYHWAT